MNKLNLLAVLALIIMLSSCAQTQPHLQSCLVGHTCGFWHGLWHGFVAPFSFIGGLFDSSISIWSVNNDGGWYKFGFVLGAGIIGTSASSTSKR
jgi:hypothetical protein